MFFNVHSSKHAPIFWLREIDAEKDNKGKEFVQIDEKTHCNLYVLISLFKFSMVVNLASGNFRTAVGIQCYSIIFCASSLPDLPDVLLNMSKNAPQNLPGFRPF